MRNDIYYKCDERGCGETAQFSSYKKARTVGGWALDKCYLKCWCPKHAPLHRNGGAKKKKKKLPKGWEQLGIEGI